MDSAAWIRMVVWSSATAMCVIRSLGDPDEMGFIRVNSESLTRFESLLSDAKVVFSRCRVCANRTNCPFDQLRFDDCNVGDAAWENVVGHVGFK